MEGKYKVGIINFNGWIVLFTMSCLLKRRVTVILVGKGVFGLRKVLNVILNLKVNNTT